MRDYRYRPRDLRWDGNNLRLGRGRVVATIAHDQNWPGMWRAKMLDRPISDMVNLSRAKDAAITLALAALDERKVA
jgi:hypothetical protein